MSLGHGAKITTDGLVFAYDMGNTKKSFKGKPTTNLIASAGKDCAAEYSGTSYPFVSQNITAQVQAAWSSSNNTFAMQFEGYRDFNGGGSGGGNDGYPVMYIYFTDWSWASTLGITDYSWKYRDQTFTMPDPTGKSVYFAIYHMNSGNRGKSYARNFQIEQSNFVTPFVNGTRSNTESILDMTGNCSITASSLIYNSNNSFSFGGSSVSNYLSIPVNSALNMPSEFTLEAWVKPVSVTNDRAIIILGQSSYYLTIDSSLRLSVYCYGKSPAGYHTDSTALTSGQWCHICAVWDSAQVRLYVNGILRKSVATTGTPNPVNYQVIMGSENNGSTRKLNGDIALGKIYNKALTGNEVKGNFAAIRGRYGI